jgi:hypothetical protein
LYVFFKTSAPRYESPGDAEFPRVAGELDEFDALDDYRMEFIEWLALHKTWLSLNDKYHQLLARQPIAIQIKANLQPAYA